VASEMHRRGIPIIAIELENVWVVMLKDEFRTSERYAVEVLGKDIGSAEIQHEFSLA
jgi:hypothetical protein